MHEYGSPEYNKLIPGASRKPGSRAAIVIDIYQVGSVCISFLWILTESDPDAVQACGFSVPLYDFVMHRTQLSRMVNNIENVERELAASRNRDTTSAGDGGAGDKSSKLKVSLRTYWLSKNMRSLDGLPGLLTAPDAVFSLTPQNNFDKDSPRPTLRRNTEVANTARDRKWFVSGVVLGAVIVFALNALARGLTG